MNSCLPAWIGLVTAIHFVVGNLFAEAGTRLRFHGGPVSRSFAIAEFRLPADGSAGRTWELQVAGQRLAVQAGDGGRAWVVLPALGAGQTVEGQLTAATSRIRRPQAEAKTNGTRLELRLPEGPVGTYQMGGSELPRADVPEKFRRGGYLHPLLTPAGRQVTDDYPANHLHHHGVWSPWTKTKFEGRTPDFWNMGDRKGRVDFVALDGHWSGAVHAGFRARHRMVDMLSQPEKTALDEAWEVRLFNLGEAMNRRGHLLEITMTQTCATASALELPKYHYGGLGVRGNWAWNGAASTRWLTSDGLTNRLAANETRGRWCWLGGLVDGQLAGLTVLGAPENFRAPQPMRVNPTEPFFCFAPSQLGDWAIEPGKPYVARYRLLITDGEPDRELIEQCWRDLAEPVRVEVLR